MSNTNRLAPSFHLNTTARDLSLVVVVDENFSLQLCLWLEGSDITIFFPCIPWPNNA